MLHSTTITFVGILAINIVRYFAVTLSLYFVLSRLFPGLKIQRKMVDFNVIKNEIIYSLLGLLVLSGTSYLVLHYDNIFMPKLYTNFFEYSWSHHVIAFTMMIFFQDFYFYWIHRLLHTKWFYKKLHYIHHKFTNPTPFTFLAHHPFDLFLQSLGLYLFLFFIPMHPIELIINSALLTIINIYGHSGYEVLPRGFTRLPLLKYINTSVNHNMHHSHNGCNYGLWFTIWDRIFGTLHPAYDDYFDKVKSGLTDDSSLVKTTRSKSL